MSKSLWSKEAFDTVLIRKNVERAWQLRKTDPESGLELAKKTFRQAVLLDKQVSSQKSLKLLVQAENTLGNLFLMNGKTDPSLTHLKHAANKVTLLKDIELEGTIANSLGRYYLYAADYEQALAMQLKAISLLEKTNNTDGLASAYNNASITLGNIHQLQRAIVFQKKALQLYEKIGQEDGNSYVNLGVNYHLLGNEKKNIHYQLLGLEKAKNLGNDKVISMAYNNLGLAYQNLEDYDKSLLYYDKALALKTKIGDENGKVTTIFNIGIVHKFLKNYPRALSYYNQSLDLCIALDNVAVRLDNYEALAEVSELMNNYKEAFKWQKKVTDLRDTIYKQESAENLALMQTRFETEQQQQENNLLVKENQVKDLEISKQNTLKNVFAVLAVLIFVFAYLIYNRFKLQQTNRLKDEKLKQEKVRIASEVSAQEKERKRISEELHDGVGQLLATAKLTVESLKYDPSPVKLESSLQLIDESCAEIRNISHDLMPGVLVKCGLKEALIEMADRMQIAGNLSIYVDIDELPRLSEAVEVHTFRVIQELVANALKHAQASTIQIQLNLEDVLTVMIEDDGIGFDKELMNRSKGNGWNNIQSRMEILHGKIEIDSQPNKGTVVFLELPHVA